MLNHTRRIYVSFETVLFLQLKMVARPRKLGIGIPDLFSLWISRKFQFSDDQSIKDPRRGLIPHVVTALLCHLLKIRKSPGGVEVAKM